MRGRAIVGVGQRDIVGMVDEVRVGRLELEREFARKVPIELGDAGRESNKDVARRWEREVFH